MFGRRNVFSYYRGRRRFRTRWMLRDFRTIQEYTPMEVDQEPENPILQVVGIDLNIETNSRDHRTDEYDLTAGNTEKNREFLVVRRGQSFDVKIDFNKTYDKQNDDLSLVFEFGSEPEPRKKSKVVFILSDKDEPGKWGAFIKSKSGNSLTISVVTPPDCFVGKWNLKIDVVKKGEGGESDDENEFVYRYSHKDPIYVLFNPWCKEDTVFLDNDTHRKEYVLNDSGIIYVGSRRKISGRTWAFGQFEGDVLDCALQLLDQKSNLPVSKRGNPIQIVRKLSALVNNFDDEGVLAGNWSGDYADGTSPLEWTGSEAILCQYYKYKVPVNYGQCWVFSGLVTTLCRTLGIPARSVTNFASAHDTNGSITIDEIYDSEGKPLDSDDSIWNFHVWNDVWMARPDLPKGYGGWQAIDATPQETSDDIYCMGPMSLNAIKDGRVDLAYDGPFVFAEVNADRVIWIQQKDGSQRVLRKLKNTVGVHISTKKVGAKEREDITHQYKYPENSPEERAAVFQANLHSTVDDVYIHGIEDMTFELITSCPETTFIGNDVEVKLKMKNTGHDWRNVSGHISVSSMYYTGVRHVEIENIRIDKKIKPQSEEVVTMTMCAGDYLDKLVDHCILRISCLAFVKQTKQTFAETEELRLRKPHLIVKAPTKGVVGQRVPVEVSFTNPLSVNLTSCQLKVEGPGLQKPLVLKQKTDVGPQQTFMTSFELTPAKSGIREVSISFNAVQLKAITASHEITVGKN